MVSAAQRVRRRSRWVRLIAKDRIVHLDPQASDASVDPDAVRLAADRPLLCLEGVRDSRRSASADVPEPQAVRPSQVLPLLDVRPTAVCPAQTADAFRPPVVVPEPLFESKLEL